MKPVVVIGSLNMDLVSRVPRIPAAGETLLGGTFATFAGGKGANQAVAAARLGWPVRMMGCVGQDALGEEMLAGLREAGVDVSAVDAVEGPSGVASILVSETGQNCIVVSPGANAALTPERLERHRGAIAGAGMVLLQLETPMAAVESATALCAAMGVPVMLDPAPAATLPDGLLRRVTWLTPNETEAAFYVPEGDVVEGLQRMGAQGVVLKRGERGSVVRRETSVEVAAFAVEAVDTTAAGDAFNGAFAVGLLQGREVADAARFAGMAAAISVTRHGAQASMPGMDEVLEALARGAVCGG